MDHKYLIQTKQALNQYERLTFINEYGKILDLLYIPIDDMMFKVTLHLQDPYYKCFTLGIVMLTTIIEEYLELLQPNAWSTTRVF